jgi:hypothetical protein
MDISGLKKALSDVSLSGTIKDCVLHIKKKKVAIQAVDLSSSVLAETNAECDLDDCTVGIGNIDLLLKYLRSISSEVKVQLNDNVLAFTSDNGSKVHYLLDECDLITSYDDEWPDNIINTLVEDYKCKIQLKQAPVDEFLSMLKLFGSNTAVISVSDKKCFLHGGTEIEHQFDVLLGKIKGVKELSNRVYSEYLLAVLSCIDFSQKAYMYLKNDDDIIIINDNAMWSIKLIPLDN